MIKNWQKRQFGEFFLKKSEAFGQKVLQDMSILIGQKLVENAKIEKLKWDILAIFWTKAWGRPVLPDMSILIGQKLI